MEGISKTRFPPLSNTLSLEKSSSNAQILPPNQAETSFRE